MRHLLSTFFRPTLVIHCCRHYMLIDSHTIYLRFEAFMLTECSEVFSGDQSCENGVVIQRFGDCLCFHHQP
jgi:hypothetical protein